MRFVLLACIIYTCLTLQPQIFTYKKIDNLSIEAGVYAPLIAIEDSFPVVLVIHGGGYLVGNYSSLTAFSERELNEMVARGWVVVSIDYRLGPYYLFPAIVEDVIDAYNWVRNDLIYKVPINPDAIAIWGDSAGAGLAVIAGYKLTPRPNVIIAFYPYCTDFTGSFAYNPKTPVSSELVVQANTLRQPRTNTATQEDWDARWSLLEKGIHEQKIGWLLTTSNPDESPDTIMKALKEYSVVHHIDADYPPTYLIHGLMDNLVPYSESTQMAEVLKNHNVIHQLDLVPGVDHAFDLYPVPEEIWQQHLVPVFDFVDKHIYLTPPESSPLPTPYSTGPENLTIKAVAAAVLIALVAAGIQFTKARKYTRLRDSADSLDL